MTKKMTTIPKSKIPKTKNTERKALFKGRVNTEAIQDQDSTDTATHTHTNTHSSRANPSCHPLILSVSAHVCLRGFHSRYFWIIL